LLELWGKFVEAMCL